MSTAEYAASWPFVETQPPVSVATEDFSELTQIREAATSPAITQTLLPEVVIFPVVDRRPSLIKEFNELLDNYSLDPYFDRLIDEVATDGIFIWELEPDYGVGVHIKDIPGSFHHAEVMMAIFPEPNGAEQFLRLESQILIEGQDPVYFTMTSNDELQPPLPLVAATNYMAILLQGTKSSKKVISTLDL